VAQSPQLFFIWLRRQGYPQDVAMAETNKRFGAPPSDKDIAKQNQMNQLAQVGGYVGGTVGGTLAAQGIGSLFSSGGAAAGAGATGAAGAAGAGATGAGIAGATGAGAAGAGAAGAAGAGAAGATGAGAAGTGAAGAGAGFGTFALPAAAVALSAQNVWEGGMKDIVRGRADRSDWINSAIDAYSGVYNIPLRLLGKKSIGKQMVSGKSEPQQERDDFRGLLQNANIADSNYQIKLADGSMYNIGLDGKTKLQNVGTNINDKQTRNVWDVDFSNPLATFAVDKLDPLIRTIYKDGKGRKLEQYTGMLVNAVTSNAQTQEQVAANIEHILRNSKFMEDPALAGLMQPTPQAETIVPRPGKGEVARVSPGLYRNDRGQLVPGKSMKEALQRAYEAPSKSKRK
jgi:hypothetical protein